MTVRAQSGRVAWHEPLPAVFLAGSLSLFIGAAFSDAAYASSYEIQWNNFASWLLAGALVLSGISLLFAIKESVKSGSRTRLEVLYAVALSITWIVGLSAALMHARDAWASMPAGLWMSVIASVGAGFATWLKFWAARPGEPT